MSDPIEAIVAEMEQRLDAGFEAGPSTRDDLRALIASWRERGEALHRLASKERSRRADAGLHGLVDPLEQAMKHNPGLTREEAEKMAEEFGY